MLAYFGGKKRLVELKAISGEIGAAEEQQIRNYMELMGIKQGILVNFQQPGKKTEKTKIEIREVNL